MELTPRAPLKERSMLAVHTETRELPVSYLVVARDDGKLGAGLRASTVDCANLLAERAERARAAGGGPMAFEPLKPGEVPQCGMMGGFGRISGGGMSMSNLASMLSGQLNRPVLDRTSLRGNFDFQIEDTPDEMPQVPPGATLPPGLSLPSPRRPIPAHGTTGTAGTETRKHFAVRSKSSSSTRWSQPTPD